MSYRTEFVVCLSLIAALCMGAVVWAANRPTSPFKHTVEVIDGCEYLKFSVHYYDVITHKGNCKNHEQ